MRIEDALNDHHWPSLFDTFGETVEYWRDETMLTDSLSVIKGSRASQHTSFDFSMTLIADDFIVKYADLVLLGIGIPQESDQLVWTDYHAVMRKFDVELPGGQRWYDYLDQQQIMVRIHTKEVSSA